ncbi:hypothetical protein QJS10_CPB15g01473 [Acorus calamus]|uniref:Uncharacterized protein n=1 Tax=Acorus calamus TaxID=4465 RepID=A0AAV9D6P0_ACOCL|nr:hypothetical protein QJS10_CPB15g01473 [Acorus calamus]
MAESPKRLNPKAAKEVNHRCYIKFFRDTLTKVKPNSHHLFLLGPFYQLLEMPKIHCEGQLVEKICCCFDSNDRCILGGVTCKFSKEKVVLITGLPFHGKAYIRLLQKHFPSTHLHRKDIRQKLIQLHPSKEEEDQEDFVRILIILMCATFLLPNKGCGSTSTLKSPSVYGLVPRFFRWGRMNDKSPLFRCSEQFHLLRIEQVVYNIDEESLQDSDSIAIGVSGFIEAS